LVGGAHAPRSEPRLDYLDDEYNLIVLTPAFARMNRAEWLALLPDYVITVWDVVSSEWTSTATSRCTPITITMEAVGLGGDRSGPVR
jgi:hypothetical protein